MAESEHVALSTASQEAMWLQQLMSDILKETRILGPPYAWHRISKCTEEPSILIYVKYHFIHDSVEAGRIKLTYCVSENMIADMLTEGLTHQAVQKTQTTGRSFLSVLTEIGSVGDMQSQQVNSLPELTKTLLFIVMYFSTHIKSVATVIFLVEC